MKRLLVLRTSLFPGPHKVSATPQFVSGPARIQQYVEGLSLIVPIIHALDSDVQVALVDNTTSHACQVPDSIVKLLPSEAVLWLADLNQFGKRNKGAGDIQVWRRYAPAIAEYERIVHFEPKLHVTNLDSFARLISNDQDYIAEANSKQVKTGYLSLSTDRLLTFASNVNIFSMTAFRQPIETLLRKYAIQRSIHLCDEVPWTKRFDPTSETWINY